VGVIIPGLNSKQSTNDGTSTDTSGEKKPEAKPADTAPK